MSDQWFYRVVGEEFGPIPQEDLLQLLEEGHVAEEDDVRPLGQVVWKPARTYSQLGFSGDDSSGATATATVERGSEERGADEWYCKTFGTELGPLTFEELQRMAENGEVAADDEVRLGTEGKWRRIGSIGRLMTLLPFQKVTREVYRPKSDSGALDRDSSAGQVPAAPVEQPTWYASIRGVEYGPVTFSQLQNWLKTGQLSLRDFVRNGKGGEFEDVTTIPNLVQSAAPERATPAPAPRASSASVATVAAPEPARPSAVESARPVAASAPPVEREPTPAPAPAPVSSYTPPASSFSAPASGFGSSSSSSSWGNSAGGFGAAASPAKFTPPPKKKASKSSSGSGSSMPSINFAALADPKILGGVVAVALIALWFLLPASQTADIAIYKRQKEILADVKTARKDNGLAALSGKYGKETEPMAKDLDKRLNPKYPHRKFLMWNAKYRLNEILTGAKQKSEQAEKDFENNLKQVALILRIKD